MKEILAILIAAMSLTACASTVQIWDRPGMTLDQFRQDSADCKFKATQATITAGAVNPSYTAGADRQMYNWCMQSKGYGVRTAGREEFPNIPFDQIKW
jgi:hypothetical protein